jgi:hypothetical protein
VVVPLVRSLGSNPVLRPLQRPLAQRAALRPETLGLQVELRPVSEARLGRLYPVQELQANQQAALLAALVQQRTLVQACRQAMKAPRHKRSGMPVAALRPSLGVVRQ